MNINLIDKCKNCGCNLYECKRCLNREFYRHIDDINKMKENTKIIKLNQVKYLLNKI